MHNEDYSSCFLCVGGVWGGSGWVGVHACVISY